MTELDASLHRKTVRATLATRLLIVGAVVLGAIIVTLQLQATLQTRQIATGIEAQQDTNTGTLDASEATLDRIVECTTPGRECYDRGQEQTSAAVGDINRISVLAAACADRPRAQSVEQIQACVIARLADADQP